MRALLLAPHHDDEALFASFLCLRYHPTVLVCTWPRVQLGWGVHGEERVAESAEACEVLGCAFEQITHLFDDEGDTIREPLRELIEDRVRDFEVVIAPAYEEGGHDQHNAVALAAWEAVAATQIPLIGYLTYTSRGRSTGTIVEPDDPTWISTKLRALACYRTQTRVPNCRPWFYDNLDMREWIA